MQYKSLRFIVNLLTSIILLAHTFVPHHHAEEHANLIIHHHENHGALGDLFANHCHSGDSFVSCESNDMQQLVQAQAILTPENTIPVLPNKIKNYKVYSSIYTSGYTYVSPHLISLDFRGPPALSINSLHVFREKNE